jgi:hypothetical protein
MQEAERPVAEAAPVVSGARIITWAPEERSMLKRMCAGSIRASGFGSGPKTTACEGKKAPVLRAHASSTRPNSRLK